MLIEIRAGEGGDDAKLLVNEMYKIYGKVIVNQGWTRRVLESSSSSICFSVKEPGASRFFLNETGGHRWQRVPPTERHGRVHTSTVTVAAIEEPKPVDLEVKDSDLDWEFFRSGGPGGQ